MQILEDLIYDSIRIRKISDRSFTTFTSGGIDSAIITTIAAAIIVSDACKFAKCQIAILQIAKQQRCIIAQLRVVANSMSDPGDSVYVLYE